MMIIIGYVVRLVYTDERGEISWKLPAHALSKARDGTYTIYDDQGEQTIFHPNGLGAIVTVTPIYEKVDDHEDPDDEQIKLKEPSPD